MSGRIGRATLSLACALLAMLVLVEAARALHLNARAAALIEARTGQLLYGSRANDELPIASTTKLMTALITLEHVGRLDTIFAQNDYYPAPEDSQIGLVPGERMSVHDLLLAMLLPSADDAAEDLAYNVGAGSVGRFLAMMNTRARQLGLGHTRYTTPIGLDTPGNHSSALDLVRLARFVLALHPFFARAVALASATLYTGDYVRHVVNRNDLVGRVRWIHGVKTGYTLDAGYVLVASGRQRGMTLISAVLGTSSEASRDAATLALLRYGFSEFRLVRPLAAGQVVARLPVRDRPGVRAAVIAAVGFAHVVPRRARLTLALELPHDLAGPMARHTVVGSARVIEGRATIGTVRLLLARALPAAKRSISLVSRLVSQAA